MSILSLFTALFARSIARAQAQRSLGAILDRPGDHLLEDIGLTRFEAEELVRDPLGHPFGGPARMTGLTPAATGGAGSSRWAISGSSRPM